MAPVPATQRARVLANHALAQTELAHVERADHPDFTKPLASARVRADLVDHVAAELAKRRGERADAGVRPTAVNRVVGDAEGGEAAVPAARAAAPPADLDDDETVEAAGLPASQPIRAQQAQLLAFLHALEADAGGHKTSHTGWAKNSEAKRAW